MVNGKVMRVSEGHFLMGWVICDITFVVDHVGKASVVGLILPQ